MRRILVGGAIFAALVVPAVVGTQTARASESFEKATGLKCEHCHKHTKEEFKEQKITGWEATQDYKECGKTCADFLKKSGINPLAKGEKRTEQQTKKTADLLVDKDWKCKHQSEPGQKLKS